MRTNKRSKTPEKYTHEGAVAYPHVKAVDQLRRSVMACFLWENEFYEEGESIAKRIEEAAAACSPAVVADIAVEARIQHNLRHVPLLLTRSLAKRVSAEKLHGNLVADTLERVIQRPDELTEFLAIYWKDKKQPLSAQVKRGLARAFLKFDAYQLAKYNRPTDIKLRDVLFLTHVKPTTQLQSEVYKKLAEGTLESPDTWEVNLSAGKNKKETFERLLKEGKLGYMALLRNLRNMVQAGVDKKLVKAAILARKGGANKVLPFRFIAAAKHAPDFEKELDEAMVANLQQAPKLVGKTVVVIDVSGSMHAGLSSKSEMDRMTVAAALGAVCREVCEEPIIYATAGSDGTRKHATKKVPARHGMALVDAIKAMSTPLGGGGIFLNQVCKFLEQEEGHVDRMIVITDEQDCGIGDKDRPTLATPIGDKNYLINVASYKNGIGYGKWTHIDGFSENIIKYILAVEAAE